MADDRIRASMERGPMAARSAELRRGKRGGCNAANMLVSRGGQPYVNDANGNTLSGGGRVNTWDSQNRLVQCVSGGNTSQYVYGADGLHRTSIVNGNPVHSVLDSSMMIREMVPSGQTLIPKATYLIGPRGPEYRRDDQTGAIRWYLYDGLGSVLGEVDPAGNLTASRKYDVYGLVRAGDSGTSRHKFVSSLGHTSEDETGLIYMRARWMDPSLGRFISEDPARDGANWFEYCRGNPVNAVDRTGLTSGTEFEVEIATGESASLGAANNAALGVLKGKAEEVALLLMTKYAALSELVAAGYAKNQVFAWQFRDVAGKIHLFRFDTAQGLLKHTSDGANLRIDHYTPYVDILRDLLEIFG
jgi:RHS repeat-associated protein